MINVVKARTSDKKTRCLSGGHRLKKDPPPIHFFSSFGVLFPKRLIFKTSGGGRGEREFPFPVIPGNTRLKFPVPSLPVAF